MNQLKKKGFLDTLKKKKKPNLRTQKELPIHLLFKEKNNQKIFIWLLQDPRFIF